MTNFIYFILILAVSNFFILKFYNEISFKYNLYDVPDEKRKKQPKPIPLLGGVFFLFNFLSYFIFEYFFNQKTFFHLLGFVGNKDILIFIVSVLIIFVVGYIDDKLKLKPITKLLLLGIICWVVFSTNSQIVINSLTFSFYSKPIDLFNLSIFFSILCVLCLINSINMLDGINIISGLYFLSVAFVLIIYNYHVYFALMLILSIIYFIKLNYNGRIFLGDSGIYIVSFLFALIFIDFYEERNFSAERILLFMFLPMIDFFRLIIVRIYNKKHPFHADENHFHHILSKKFDHKTKIIFLIVFLYLPIILDYLFRNNELFIIVFMLTIYFLTLSFKLKKSKNE